jgi:hypothetical protein
MNEQHQYIEGFLPKEESVARIAQSSLYENGAVIPFLVRTCAGGSLHQMRIQAFSARLWRTRLMRSSEA